MDDIITIMDLNDKKFAFKYCAGIVPYYEKTNDKEILRSIDINPNIKLSEKYINEFVDTLNFYIQKMGFIIYDKYKNICDFNTIKFILEKYIKIIALIEIFNLKTNECLAEIKENKSIDNESKKIFKFISEELSKEIEIHLLTKFRHYLTNYYHLKYKNSVNNTSYIRSTTYMDYLYFSGELSLKSKISNKGEFNTINLLFQDFSTDTKKINNDFNNFFPFHVEFEKDETPYSSHREEIYENTYYGPGSHNNGPWPTGKTRLVVTPYRLNFFYCKFNFNEIINYLQCLYIKNYVHFNSNEDKNIGIDWCKKLEI